MHKARIHFPALVVAMAFLFFSCQNEGNGAQAANTAASSQSAATTGLQVVFIDSDSLQRGYTELAAELARLEENINKAQENLSREGNALQQELTNLQNRAQQGLLSPNQIQSEQQRMARKEQEILQRREVALGSIQQEQLELQTRFTEKVRVILEALQEENGYDFILNQGPGSDLLITNPAYDITNIVLERLNAAENSDSPASTQADSTATE